MTKSERVKHSIEFLSNKRGYAQSAKRDDYVCCFGYPRTRSGRTMPKMDSGGVVLWGGEKCDRMSA